jgi:hypothetical protein
MIITYNDTASVTCGPGPTYYAFHSTVYHCMLSIAASDLHCNDVQYSICSSSRNTNLHSFRSVSKIKLPCLEVFPVLTPSLPVASHAIHIRGEKAY